MNAPASVRKQIEVSLREWRFSYRYDIVYPEDLFDELLFGEKHQDLLTLENILADSVDAIVLVIESYGAVAELGAFANNDRLRKKLVCVVDRKFRRSRSFINYGPIRLLKDTGDGAVVYGDYSNTEDMIEPIRKAITKVKNVTTESADVTNLLQAHHYILPCIFLFEPATREQLYELVMHASGCSKHHAEVITSAALSTLRKTRNVMLTSEGYRLTVGGHKRFVSLRQKGRAASSIGLNSLDKVRTAVLNWKYRGKPLII